MKVLVNGEVHVDYGQIFVESGGTNATCMMPSPGKRVSGSAEAGRTGRCCC